jgi:hypothetical protein
MIVSHKNKFIYFHIPKTGGSSFAWNFKNYINYPQSNKNIGRKPGWQRIVHYDLKQHSSYLDNLKFCKNHSDYFKFAFVRNPWDLTFSWFLARNRQSSHRITKKDFNLFLFDYVQRYSPVFSPFKFLKKYTNKGFRALNKTQLSYISDSNGIIQIDYIARLEKYDEEIKYLKKKLGIILKNNEKVNVANFKKLDYRKFYDDEGAKLIRDLFEDDINAFNYCF